MGKDDKVLHLCHINTEVIPDHTKFLIQDLIVAFQTNGNDVLCACINFQRIIFRICFYTELVLTV